MNDPITTEQTQVTQASSYMVRHNETIIGFFGNQMDADDALNGYSMDNNIEIGDTLDILQIV